MTLTCDRVNLSRRPEVEHHASSDLLEALTFTEVYFQVFNIIFLPSVYPCHRGISPSRDMQTSFSLATYSRYSRRTQQRSQARRDILSPACLPRGLLMVGHAVSTSSRRFPKAILVFALQPLRLTNPSEQFHSFSHCPELVATGEGQERRSPGKSTALLTFFTTTDCGFDQYTRLPTLMFTVCIKLSASKSFYLTI